MGWVIHFCKHVWVALINTYFRFLHTFSLIVAYWQALEKSCPKHVPLKLFYKPNVSQLTTKFKVEVITFKLEPSSFTNAMFFFLKLNLSNKFVKFQTNAYPKVFIISNSLIVICFGCRSHPKKIRTKAKISLAPLFIHKSKLAVVVYHSIRIGRTYSWLIFSTKFDKFLVKTTLWKEN